LYCVLGHLPDWRGGESSRKEGTLRAVIHWPQWSLHKDHPDRRSLRRTALAKIFIVTLAVLGAIVFGVLYKVVSQVDYNDLSSA
jgi:hypothetical protein